MPLVLYPGLAQPGYEAKVCYSCSACVSIQGHDHACNLTYWNLAMFACIRTHYQHVFYRRVGPDTSRVGPDTSSVGPDTNRVGPDTSPVGPDTSPVGPDTSRVGPDTS